MNKSTKIRLLFLLSFGFSLNLSKAFATSDPQYQNPPGEGWYSCNLGSEYISPNDNTVTCAYYTWLAYEPAGYCVYNSVGVPLTAKIYTWSGLFGWELDRTVSVGPWSMQPIGISDLSTSLGTTLSFDPKSGYQVQFYPTTNDVNKDNFCDKRKPPSKSAPFFK